jgi:hypothetical protein
MQLTVDLGGPITWDHCQASMAILMVPDSWGTLPSAKRVEVVRRRFGVDSTFCLEGCRERRLRGQCKRIVHSAQLSLASRTKRDDLNTLSNIVLSTDLAAINPLNLFT